ncbi:MAG: M23 family metallopeptidase [Deltaproteobacteria bacterium]|nr:M23 family metallopeptidase [Deltaproteobacteria bacterium]
MPLKIAHTSSAYRTGALGRGLARGGRGALWPSLAGAVVVLGVVATNLWSLWHSAPELTPMEPLERLSALHAAAALPATAEANADLGHTGGARGDAVAGTAAAASPAPRVQAPMAGSQPAATSERTRSWVVQPGESLGLALAHLDINGAAQREVIEAYSTLRKPEHLQAGWRLWARLRPVAVMDAGALHSLVIAPASGEGVTIERRGDRYVAEEGGMPGTLLRQAVRCGIVGSLEASLQRCGEGEALAAQLAVILSDRLHPAVDLKTGDELRLVVDKLVDGDQLVRYLDVAAVDIRTPAGQRTTAVFFDDERGAAGYFGLDGQSLEAMFLRQPLRVGNRTSGFGMRLHPILHRMKAHYGVDFAAATGTPIYAAADGTLVSAHRAGAAGNMVRLRHVDGYVTEYMHLHRFATNLKAGDSVRKGQVIGQVGTTGRSTGPHLHFGVKKNGAYLDPTGLGEVLEPALPARDRKAFDAHATEMLRLIDALGGVRGAT